MEFVERLGQLKDRVDEERSRRLASLSAWLRFGLPQLLGSISYGATCNRVLRAAPARWRPWLTRLLRPRARAARLKQQCRERGLDRVADTFILYRIIGNDLYPRHKKGQSEENVRFILEQEPSFERCEKRWVINRIIDPQVEAALIGMLEGHGQRYVRIPFDWQEYAAIGWDLECFPEPGFLLGPGYKALDEVQKDRALARAYRLKNNYVMNLNGARNRALREGRKAAKWVLPWDGNCFLTKKAWGAIVQAVTRDPHFKYFVVPMARVTDNGALLANGFCPQAVDEPPILFRCDAAEEFDEAHPYGRRPKVELFYRLGIPGPWDHCRRSAWDLPYGPWVGEAGQFGRAGWVARLSSGQPQLEQPTKSAFSLRGITRTAAIISTLSALDEQVLRSHSDPKRLMVYSEPGLRALRQAAKEGTGPLHGLGGRLLAEAQGALGRGPYSVKDKLNVAPSGDPHDYWHPAPFWWPNPASPDGLPYLKRDGEWLPGTRLHEPGSERYDRTRLQKVFEDTTTLALAWRASRERRFAEHGALLVRTWFVDAERRINPHLRYAQARMGHNHNEGLGHGIIELKDLYYFLDAVRILDADGILDEADRNGLSAWLRQYLDWMLTSPQGLHECLKLNNHGTFYELQLSAIAAWLGDMPQLVTAFRRARERVLQQFTPEGSQPQELARPESAHYCCFNLQGWVTLATLAERCGDDLWRYESSDGHSIRRGLEWFLSQMARRQEGPFGMAEAFDLRRLGPLWAAYGARFGPLEGRETWAVAGHTPVEPAFFPYGAIPPWWRLTEP